MPGLHKLGWLLGTVQPQPGQGTPFIRGCPGWRGAELGEERVTHTVRSSGRLQHSGHLTRWELSNYRPPGPVSLLRKWFIGILQLQSTPNWPWLPEGSSKASPELFLPLSRISHRGCLQTELFQSEENERNPTFLSANTQVRAACSNQHEKPLVCNESYFTQHQDKRSSSSVLLSSATDSRECFVLVNRRPSVVLSWH